MFVVLDSNIWISELGLRSALGSAARFYLQQRNAVLVVPEVVRLESERHLRSELLDYTSNIRKSHSKLLSVFGKLKEIVLPGEEEIESVVQNLFGEVGIAFEEVPLTLDSARSSFIKTIDKKAPSDKSQQFKDGVIWADCVGLLDRGSVHLVSEDKAFYEGRDYNQGLATSLREEIANSPNRLFIYKKIHDLLEELHSDIALSEEDLFQQFLAIHNESVHGTVARNGFQLANLAQSLITPFATANPSRLYVEFEMLVDCEPTIDDGRTEGRLFLKGDGTLALDSGQYEELRNFGEEFTFMDAEGTEQLVKNAVAHVGSAVIGHREVQYSVRHKLD